MSRDAEFRPFGGWDWETESPAERRHLEDRREGERRAIHPERLRYLNEATSEERKGMPIATGVLDYFPDALAAVAAHSKAGNDKHNPGQPLHWNRPLSRDHADCIARHLASRGTVDVDGTRHSAALAWRALALLQLEIEEEMRSKK